MVHARGFTETSVFHLSSDSASLFCSRALARELHVADPNSSVRLPRRREARSTPWLILGRELSCALTLL